MVTIISSPSPEMPIAGDCVNHRTLHEIVWSCLVTVFACTWVALHPSVPDPVDGHRKITPTRWDNLKKRVISTLGVAIAPEFMVVWATGERLQARRIVNEYNRFCSEESADSSTSVNRPRWTLTHGFFLIMGGFMLQNKQGQPIGPLTPDTLSQAMKTKELANWPPLTISREEIEDKSKGDFFTKSVVVVQTTWFIVECIGRTVAGLPLVELEVITLAFAVMNIVTFTMWWNKPQNVNLFIPVVVTCPEMVSRPPPQDESAKSNCLLFELQTPLHKEQKERLTRTELFFRILSLPFISLTEVYANPARMSCYALPFRLALIFVATIFASFHFSSWSTIFPSEGSCGAPPLSPTWLYPSQVGSLSISWMAPNRI